MIHFTVSQRRSVRNLARAGAVVSTAMLMVNIAGVVGAGGQMVSAATNAGAVHVVVPPGTAAEGQPLSSGGSATAFALAPPSGVACTGDSATGGYRIQSYMVPAAVDPATLTFDANGPLPAGTGANYRQPMYSAGGTPFVNATTGIATATSPGGLLTGIPAFAFDLFGAAGPTVVPAGTYNLGFACTLGTASATQLDKYWNVQFTFAADPADAPSGITWTVIAGTPATTTTTVAAGATTTTTIKSGTTTTTAKPATSTTVATTTATIAAATPTTVRSGSAGSTTGRIPTTGSSPLPIALWAILLLMFGRMAILVGRPLKVLPPHAP